MSQVPRLKPGTSQPAADVGRRTPELKASSRLWYAVGAGFIAWSLHLLLSYWAVSAACDTGFGAIELVLHLLTLVALAATLAAGFFGWRAWRAGPDGEGGAVVDPARRGAFMGLAGVGLSALFLIAILYGEVTVFFVRPCV